MADRKWTSLEVVNVVVLSLTLLVGGFQAYELRLQAGDMREQSAEVREHDRRMVKPLLEFDLEPDQTQDVVGFSVTNVGVGPAIIKSMKIFVDRTPVKDWDAVRSYGSLEYDAREVDLSEDAKLAVGEREWLFGENVKNKITDSESLKIALDYVDKHVGVLITYCSLYDECQTECSDEGRC